jgi:hypothetical protein
LLEQRATRHQALLDFVACELYVEIARETLDDLVEPKIDRLQCGKLGGRLDQFVELFEFLVRIYVFHAHFANRTPFGGSGPILTMVKQPVFLRVYRQAPSRLPIPYHGSPARARQVFRTQVLVSSWIAALATALANRPVPTPRRSSRSRRAGLHSVRLPSDKRR